MRFSFRHNRILGWGSDWKKLATKAERIGIFGEEPKNWCRLLRRVLASLVTLFNVPDASGTIEFWQMILRGSGGVYGRTYFSVSLSSSHEEYVLVLWNTSLRWSQDVPSGTMFIDPQF